MNKPAPLGLPKYLNPRLLSNNLLLVFLIAVLEEYFKSTFIALLKYSDNKESFFKNNQLRPNKLVEIASSRVSIEAAIAETMSFQNISAIGNHFGSLEPNLKLIAELRKPYRRRKQTLYDSLTDLVTLRHSLIHKGNVEVKFTDEDSARAIDDLEDAVKRCYRRITKHYNWEYFEGWGKGSELINYKKNKSKQVSIKPKVD